MVGIKRTSLPLILISYKPHLIFCRSQGDWAPYVSSSIAAIASHEIHQKSNTPRRCVHFLSPAYQSGPCRHQRSTADGPATIWSSPGGHQPTKADDRGIF